MPNPLGFNIPHLAPENGPRTQHVVVQQPLRRLLAFLGHSIDEVVNDPIVKNKVYGYYKLDRQITRNSEIVELEQWWSMPSIPRPRSHTAGAAEGASHR